LTLIFNTHSQELYYNFETIKEDVDFIYNFIMQGISKEA